ncbi:MAG: pantetheine-phosphate adenylyltransferase [Candidatus Omnitrophica bacterium]|nr:pantetheine-phosphate adenylyltransferase [Candidatus Omnitrophota bacterium]MDD5488781.1 pantetheine-phosphate adenylyltransferase [Candidatus Omnitrophota bacterium]
MNRIAVYPGTFDPVTYGHIDVVKRVSSIYDKVYVAVAHSRDKKPLFTVTERMDMLRNAVSAYENVTVEDFDGLVVKYAALRSAKVVVRGLRMISDFEYEFQMALTNRKLAPDIETVFMMPNESYSYLSSKLIKEVARLGADVSSFVPKNVEIKLKEKMEI